VLAPGLEEFSRLTNRPSLGTLPYVAGLGLDGEDSLALDARREAKPPLGSDVLRVAVARLGRISNFTDFDALAHEPGVFVSFTTSPAEILSADLAIIPGTKATVADLAWLRSRGLSSAFEDRARRGLPTLGVCGGYQMLGERIVDGIESGEEAPGLGLLPVETVFGGEKLLGRPAGRAPLFGDAEVSGYEIRHGRVHRRGGEPLFVGVGFEEGCRAGAVFGTSWHGVMESDAFRRSFLRFVAGDRGLDWTPGKESFAAAREAQLDLLGDLVSENVDRDALLRLIENGPPEDLPVVGHQQGGSNGAAREAPSPNGKVATSASTALAARGGADPDGPDMKAKA
jgi:adenosylcobyric acid synthase